MLICLKKWVNGSGYFGRSSVDIFIYMSVLLWLNTSQESFVYLQIITYKSKQSWILIGTLSRYIFNFFFFFLEYCVSIPNCIPMKARRYKTYKQQSFISPLNVLTWWYHDDDKSSVVWRRMYGWRIQWPGADTVRSDYFLWELITAAFFTTYSYFIPLIVSTKVTLLSCFSFQKNTTRIPLLKAAQIFLVGASCDRDLPFSTVLVHGNAPAAGYESAHFSRTVLLHIWMNVELLQDTFVFLHN